MASRIPYFCECLNLNHTIFYYNPLSFLGTFKNVYFVFIKECSYSDLHPNTIKSFNV